MDRVWKFAMPEGIPSGLLLSPFLVFPNRVDFVRITGEFGLQLPSFPWHGLLWPGFQGEGGDGGRCWVRTSDFHRVKVALSH